MHFAARTKLAAQFAHFSLEFAAGAEFPAHFGHVGFEFRPLFGRHVLGREPVNAARFGDLAIVVYLAFDPDIFVFALPIRDVLIIDVEFDLGGLRRDWWDRWFGRKRCLGLDGCRDGVGISDRRGQRHGQECGHKGAAAKQAAAGRNIGHG